MAILLPHVMRAYGSSVYDKLADLCDICAMEVDTPDGMISAEVRAETFLQWMEELKEKLGIPMKEFVLAMMEGARLEGAEKNE